MYLALGPDERPRTEEAARSVINKICRGRGYIDESDEIELSKTSPQWQEGYRRREENRRQVYAHYTKT